MDHSEHLLEAAAGFMPHGHCYLWQPALVWTHVISDFLIGSAYVAISLALYFIVRRVKVEFSAVLLSFGVFIGACGATHFIEIWNLWNADYWFGGWVKALTAFASVSTAVYLVRLRPKIFAIAETAALAESRAVELAELNRTLEKRVEERTRELRRVENKFRDTFDKAAVGMAHVAPDGRWLIVNPRICEVTGYAADELLQKTFADITHPEDLAKDWKFAQALARGEIPSYEVEKRYIRKSGEIIWVKLSVAASRDEDGELCHYISCVTDISAERAARVRAELEQAKIANLFDQVPTPIAIYEGPEHRIALANPEYRRQVGKENLLGLRCVDAFPMTVAKGVPEILDEAYASGRPWNAAEFPVRLHGPGGEITERFINATIQPYRDVNGDVAGLINLSFDVTEQVLARRKFEESERRLQLALKTANMGVWEWDIRSGEINWDSPMVELFGGPNAKFGGTAEEYTNRIHPDDREAVWSEIHKAIESGMEFEVEHRVVRDDGSHAWIHGRGGVVADETGKPAKLLGVALDIEARKRVLDAIKSSEERFRTLFEQSPLSIEIHTPDGLLRQANKAWMKLWAVSEEQMREVVGRYNVLEDPQLEMKGILKYIRQGFDGVYVKTPPTHYDPKVLGVDGRIRWVETYISPIKKADGSLSEVVIIHEDITERKSADEALLAAKDAAEAASRAKTQFLANMSHEIRTPLGAMLGFAQLMLEDEQATETQKNSLQTIVRNGEQLYRIINELLDISKVEANKFEIEKSRFDLDEVIRDVTSLLSVKAEQKGIDFIVASEGPLPDTVFTDPVRFRQILLNVIGNAIKFTERGKVDVTFKLREHEMQQDGACLEIKVQDTGVGLPADMIDKLFQPFMQADQATTRRFGGTGLGLYLSRNFARALGGDIKLVECREGRGCTFLIVLDVGRLEKRPLMNFQAVSGEHVVKGDFKPPQIDRLHGVRVLVVDDSPDNLELTHRFLSAAGAKVEKALGARVAFEKLAADEYDVIIMDIQMPDMDGYEAVRRLRGQGYEKPVIALTAHAMKGERERCLEAGFDGYLVKPIDRPALVREIKVQAERQPSV